MTAEVVTLAEVTAALDEVERDLLAWLRRRTRGHCGIEFGRGKHRSIVREVTEQFASAVPETFDAMREQAAATEEFVR